MNEQQKSKQVRVAVISVLCVLAAAVVLIMGQRAKMQDALRKTYTAIPTEYVTDISLDKRGMVNIQLDTPYPSEKWTCDTYTLQTDAGEEKIAIVTVSTNLYALERPGTFVRETFNWHEKDDLKKIYYYARPDQMVGGANMVATMADSATQLKPGSTLTAADLPSEAVLLWQTSDAA